jgi:transposase
VKSYLHPLRQQARQVPVRRFETPPGRQGQVDWGEIGTIQTTQGVGTLYCFVMTLSSSRSMFAPLVTDPSVAPFLKLHEAGFLYLGGVAEQIL